MEEQKNTNKKKLAGGITAGAGLLAVTALGIGSMANWTDSGSVGADFDAGEFSLELSSDEASWDSDGAAVELSFSTLDESNDKWGPGDTYSDDFHVRVGEASSHSGEVTFGLDADSNFNDHYDWTITVLGEGEPEEGDEGTEPTDLVLSSSDWSGQTFTLEPNEQLDFEIEVTATDDVVQGQEYRADWLFEAEQLPNT